MRSPRPARRLSLPRHLRPFNSLSDIDNPFHDHDTLIIACDRLCLHRKKISSLRVRAQAGLGDDWREGFCIDRLDPGSFFGCQSRKFILSRAQGQGAAVLFEKAK